MIDRLAKVAAAAAFSMLLSGLAPAASPGAPNNSGLWEASPAGSESGWGVAVDHHGDNIFAALATYDELGSPTWFVMPDPTLYVPGPVGEDIWPDTTWQGAINQMTGPPYDAVPFDPSKVIATAVGGGGFHFPRLEDNGIGVLYWGINGTGVYGPYRSITRQVNTDVAPVCVDGGTRGSVPNVQGFWWNPAEAGWGLYLAIQGNSIFVIWFTYDAAGKATWFVMRATETAPNVYTGAIFRKTGPAYSEPSFDPSRVAQVQVGSGTLTFSDRNDGAFSYTANSVSQTKNITRQTPVVCDTAAGMPDLHVATTGNGTVTSAPTGIACGADCTQSYAAGTGVTLIATPDAGWVFTGWDEACTGTGICGVSVSESRNVTATFARADASGASSNEWVQRSFVAYYGRPADLEGLGYWASRMDSEGGSLASIIATFGTSAEFIRRYGSLTGSQLIDTLYLQALGRGPDVAGKAYYLDRLSKGMTTPQTITLDLLGGATGADVLTVRNRLDVANHYTGKVAQGCPYGSEEMGVASLTSVTFDPATAWAAKMIVESRCAP